METTRHDSADSLDATGSTGSTGSAGSADSTGSAGLAALTAAVAVEYAGLAPGYLNTATLGILPARTREALRVCVDAWAAGRPDLDGFESAVVDCRASFARITGVPVEQVALAGTVAGAVGLIAAGLPAGAEVVLAEEDFSSLVQPFAARTDLDVRLVPLAGIAEAVRPGTALVAVSAAQSADGRVADLAAVRAAAAEHGARTLLDGTQSVGWLPVDAGDYDYLVCHGYKWLTSPHGACFLTVRPGAEPTLSASFAGWYAAADPWASCYGPIAELAPGARQFDARPAYPSFVGAARSLALIEEVGVPAIHARALALAERLRSGLAGLGYEPVARLGADSTIVAAAGMRPEMADRLTAAGVRFSARAGNLRLSPHFYNSEADVDRALNALA